MGGRREQGDGVDLKGLGFSYRHCEWCQHQHQRLGMGVIRWAQAEAEGCDATQRNAQQGEARDRDDIGDRDRDGTSPS